MKHLRERIEQMPDRKNGARALQKAGEKGKEVETFGHGTCKGLECLPAGRKFLQKRPSDPASVNKTNFS